ncbi:hypothetical protein ERJ75_001525400 [Trypanosoma vivax]|uniref:Trypanosoma vivax n=1 Tax=Trypanosoma vivax (strain Y486) TaxID=1055687 RepID=G0UB83_TRYVY|nr:Trypanosoma vivax [Trypanosoma vivax]KAH8606241.1 hypothetical protein ERJ75_001525400 [Trypanosoma vivax]CCC53070.1 Trypanosoma vivax [Trypanosoma vivax Y486]
MWAPIPERLSHRYAIRYDRADFVPPKTMYNVAGAFSQERPRPRSRRRGTQRTPRSASPLRSRSRSHSNSKMDGIDNVKGNGPMMGERKKDRSLVALNLSSGIMLAVVAAWLYFIYALCVPYLDSIIFAVILSVIMHSNSCEENYNSKYARLECVENMQRTRQKWAERSQLFTILGSVLSLGHFFSFAVKKCAISMGFNKLLSIPRKKVCRANQEKWRGGRESKREIYDQVMTEAAHVEPPRDASFAKNVVLHLFTAAFICTFAHFIFGLFFFICMHVVFLAFLVVCIPIMAEERFVTVFWRLWRYAVVVFFVVGLSYNLALDVISISEVVKRTTSVVVDTTQQWSRNTNNVSSNASVNTVANATSAKVQPTNASYASPGVVSVVMAKANEFIIQELAHAFNHSNVTDIALAVRLTAAPLFSTFASDLSFSAVVAKYQEIRDIQGNIQDLLLKVDWESALWNFVERWKNTFFAAGHVLASLTSDVMELFDYAYAFMLFGFVLRHLLSLENTLLYYIMVKVLKVIHPRSGEARARWIEREITTSFLTLIQSIWQMSCFHFCITFCLFKYWSFPTPFLCGAAASFLAVFPPTPKWFSPVSLALLYTVSNMAWSVEGLVASYSNSCVWSCLLAFFASYMDERLLSVSRGCLYDSSHINDDDAEDAKVPAGEPRQMPALVVGTALVLGYVRYGVRGILLGPMTAITARVLYDSWDVVLVN